MSKKKRKKNSINLNDKDKLFLAFTTEMCDALVDNFACDISNDDDYLEDYCLLMEDLVKLAKYLIWDSDFDTKTEQYEDLLTNFANSLAIAAAYENHTRWEDDYDTLILDMVEGTINDFIGKNVTSKRD